jgi:alpha-tubulin suppressor-like RCC1 family protein
MPYQPNTNFRDSNGVDLGKKLVTKDYILEVYPSLLDTLAPGFNPTPALWVWGGASGGQLGINDSVTNRSTPITTLLGETNWKQISGGSFAGDSFGLVAAIKTDGTLWTWGNNSHGQLGVNATASRSTPVTTFAGGTNWKQVSAAPRICAAIKTDGTLWIWGNNDPAIGTVGGFLGVNDITNRSTPVTTFAGGTNWKQVSCGGLGTTAAIKTDGTLWVWGSNNNGQLGINEQSSSSSRSTPVTTLLGGNNWKQVSVSNGNSQSISAIKTDGTLWTWGINGSGQLGVNDTTARSTPVTTLLGGTNWKSATMGDRHITAIKTDGTLWTWGNNTNGQLGVNNTTNRLTPVTTLLGGTNWKSLIKGYNVSGAIKTDGTLWTWGRNAYGQLGVNDTTDRSTPVTTLLGGNNWKQASFLGQSTLGAIQSVDYI